MMAGLGCTSDGESDTVGQAHPLTWGRDIEPPFWREGPLTPEDLFNRFEKKFDSIMASISGVGDRITRLESQIQSSDDHRTTMAASLGTVQTELGDLRGTVRIMEERYNNQKIENVELKMTVLKLEQARWWMVGAAAGFSTATSVLVLMVDRFLSQ